MYEGPPSATSTGAARELAMMYARTCNIACRHCGIDSSPQNKDRMRLEDARRYVVEAAALPRMRKMTFTGGEPFLFPKELEELIGLASGLGLTSRVVTNGFWATDPNRGLRLLSRMKAAGLGEINFSADRFHLEFLKPVVLRNALECARKLGYSRIVSFVTNADTEPLDLFSSMYGVARDTLVDLRPLIGRARDVMEELKEEKVFVYAGGLIGLGRAAEFPAELRYFPSDFFASKPCSEVVHRPVVYPNGDLQACCCAGGKIGTFTVGNLRETPLEDLYERMEHRLHFQLINSHGPVELYRAIRRARPELPRGDFYTSVCEMCVRATDGLTASEVDEIVGATLAEKAMVALGIIGPPKAPAPFGRRLPLPVLG